MKNIFKKRAKPQIVIPELALRHIRSVEAPTVEYIEYPDGLRLRYEDGKYVGWYVA